MPILSTVGNKSLSQRLTVAFLYIALTFLGATMVVPFLITLTNSNSNHFDYDRFSIVPRSIWSEDDRFFKGIVLFVNRYQGWYDVLQNNFEAAPKTWTSWRAIGRDTAGTDAVAASYLNASPEDWKLWERQAADYAEFTASYPIEDSLVNFTDEKAADLIGMFYERQWAKQNPELAKRASSSERERQGLALLSREWEVPIPSFVSIKFDAEIRAPLAQQSWAPPLTQKQTDFLRVKQAIRSGFATPGVLGKWKSFLRANGYSAPDVAAFSPLPENAPAKVQELWIQFSQKIAPASAVIPYPLRLAWYDFLGSDEVRRLLALGDFERFDVAYYDKLTGTNYTKLGETPFPIPSVGFDKIRPIWDHFVQNRYPLRLVQLDVTPELETQYQQFLQAYPSMENVNRLVGTSFTEWTQFKLSPVMPPVAGLRDVWINFVKNLPANQRQISSSEAAYQQFLLKKYGSLENVNQTYGWKLQRIEEAFPPFDKAYAVTYRENSTSFAWEPITQNYGTMSKFLLTRGNALPVTLWLIVLSVFVTLTVNPIAGYALSRFNMKGKDKIILFCLATSAFPAMVSAIPGYLLMRDLGLLNTFFALVLPGAASGMSIFILKGFFDSLPQELYEAATIDGAKEWQIFGFVTIPMVKPILAINALHAFLAAYGGWEWALIICQDPKMWTLSVWLYQANEWWAQTPWITTSGFVLASIPTLIVFLFCQNIIMRGIIVPSMK